jgi:heat shock protein HslJ
MKMRISTVLELACIGVVSILAAACRPVMAPPPPPVATPSTAITDIVWQWTSVKNRPTGETTEVANLQAYTIIFRDDGTLSGQADCNTFTGTYSTDGGFFIASTPDVMAACGGDSLDIQYFELLDAIVTGGPDGAGGLALETAGGEQRMTFIDGGAAAAP